MSGEANRTVTHEALAGERAGARLCRLVSHGLRQSAVTLDQLVFSAITFALQLVIAPNASAAEFGVFSLVAIVQIGLWHLGRGVASEPLLVSRVVDEHAHTRIRGAAATALCLGLAGGVACLAAGAAVTGMARSLLLIQALATPFTAVLDHSRYVNFARKQGRRALSLDGSWLVLFLATTGVYTVLADLDVLSGYLLWALTAIPVAIVAAFRTGTPLALRDVPGWITSQRDLIPGFVIDAAYLAAGTSAVFALTAWLIGLEELGLLRKALIPVTALIVLFIGIGTSMLAHLAGRPQTEVIRAPALVTGLSAAVCVLCAVLTLLAPAELLSAVLGNPWSRLQPLVLILFLYAFLQTAGQLALIAVKSSGRAWLGPAVRTVQFGTELALVAALGLAFGVIGVAIGMIVSWFAAVLLAWTGLLTHRRGPKRAAEVEGLPNASG